MKKKRPTIKEIASIAGVTHATVSMVLNNRSGPSEATREKVMKIVEEVGYVPNINARNLAKKKSETIGLFLLNLSSDKNERIFYYYLEFLQDLIIEARNRGYTLLVYTDQDETREKISYAEYCIEQDIKTAIFLGMLKDDENIESLKELKTTQVIVFDTGEIKGLNNIISDSYTGLQEMFEYFKQQNLKKLAVIAGSDIAEIQTRKKKKEIEIFAKKQNIEVEYFEGNFLQKSGYEIGKHLNINKYDAIFAMNDAMAIGLRNALQERGITAQQDIPVIGFDGILVANVLSPALPSIAHDNERILESIFKMIENEDKKKLEFIPTKFINR